MKDKYIGCDIDDKKTVACVVTEGRKRLHLTFEISGQAAYYYDALRDGVDTLTVSNPHKMTWIYRTRKKNDRIDARKLLTIMRAMLLTGELFNERIVSQSIDRVG